MTSAEPNLRYELRAYETANSCRLASILTELMTEPPTPIDRDAVASRWEARYPRHMAMTGSSNVRSRVTRGLSLLATANIAKGYEVNELRVIEVNDKDRLALAAGNLAIVEDDQGVALPPSSWSTRPRVPDHLLEVQSALEQQLQSTAGTE
jgi:hypothetical protein